MFLLGLLVPIVYIPGYTGATIPTQLPFLSLALIPSLWRKGPWTPLHWLGTIFLIYASISIGFASDLQNSIMGMWIVSISALAFWLGSTLLDLNALWRGLAWGLGINSAVAIIQAFGFQSVPVSNNDIAGLLYNQTVLGASCAIVILGLLSERLYHLIPLLLPGLYLAHSRGGWFILILGLAARIHWVLPTGLLIGASFWWTNHLDPSNIERLQIWYVAASTLTLSGHGVGSFYSVWYTIGSTVIHPEFVHNDYLQLAFEFGLGAIPLYCLFAWAIARTLSPTLIAIAALGTFYFPLHCPLIMFISAVVTGHASRACDLTWLTRLLGRSPFLSRDDHGRLISYSLGRQGLSLPSNHPCSEA